MEPQNFAKMGIEIGKKAPEFKGIDQEGNVIRLKDFTGKKLALYFYPADNTPSCTVQACNLRDNFSALIDAGIQIVGVSPDSAKKHQHFIGKHQLPFPLIADVDTKIAQAYGVWGPKKFMGREYVGLIRTTFVINEKGKLIAIINRPKTKDHAAEILAAFNA